MAHTYTIRFKVPVLTGDEVHTIVIEDNSLSDTWQSALITEVPADVQKAGCSFSHDINVYDKNDGEDAGEELVMCAHPIYINEFGDLDTNFSVDSYKCEIISIQY